MKTRAMSVRPWNVREGDIIRLTKEDGAYVDVTAWIVDKAGRGWFTGRPQYQITFKEAKPWWWSGNTITFYSTDRVDIMRPVKEKAA